MPKIVASLIVLIVISSVSTYSMEDPSRFPPSDISRSERAPADAGSTNATPLIADFLDKKGVELESFLVEQSPILSTIAKQPVSGDEKKDTIQLNYFYQSWEWLKKQALKQDQQDLNCTFLEQCKSRISSLIEANNLADHLNISLNPLSNFLFNLFKSKTLHYKTKLEIADFTTNALSRLPLIKQKTNKKLIELINTDNSASSYTLLFSLKGSLPLIQSELNRITQFNMFFRSTAPNLHFASGTEIFMFDMTNERFEEQSEVAKKGEKILDLVYTPDFHKAYVKTTDHAIIFYPKEKIIQPLPPDTIRVLFDSYGEPIVVGQKNIKRPYRTLENWTSEVNQEASESNAQYRQDVLARQTIPTALTRYEEDFIYFKKIDDSTPPKMAINPSISLYSKGIPPFQLNELITGKYISSMQMSFQEIYLGMIARKSELVSKERLNEKEADSATTSSFILLKVNHSRRPFDQKLIAQFNFEENASAALRASLNQHIPEIVGLEKTCGFYFFSSNTIHKVGISRNEPYHKIIYTFDPAEEIKEIALNEEKQYLVVRTVNRNSTSQIAIINLYDNTLLNSYPAQTYKNTGFYKRILTLSPQLSLIAYKGQKKGNYDTTTLHTRMVINPLDLAETLLIHIVMNEKNTSAHFDDKFRLKLYMPEYDQLRNRLGRLTRGSAYTIPKLLLNYPYEFLKHHIAFDKEE